jgi:DNA-binding transcriptional LysR family regulator
MHETNLTAIDLNLLVALDVLLATRSTTLAGKQLSLSQPATSHALARLRELLGDPLLVRSGKLLLPTPFAERLKPRLRAALAALSDALQEPAGFEPSQARRVFRIGTSDYVASVLVPPLARELARTAPNIDLFVKTIPLPEVEPLGSGELDLVLSPSSVGGDHPSLRSAALIRAGHPLAGKRMTLDRFCACSHVLVAPVGSSARGTVDDALARLGRSRRVAVAVPHALMAPLVVVGSDYLLTTAGGIARRVAPELGLRTFEPPVELTGFEIAMHWHVRNQADPAHVFLRESLLEVARRHGASLAGTQEKRGAVSRRTR